MKIKENIKKYFGNKSLKIFVVNSIIFFGIFFILNFFTLFYFRHTQFFLNYLATPANFYFPFLSGLSGTKFLNSVIFVIIIFMIFIKDRIKKLEINRTTLKNIIIFGSISIFFLIFQYVFKFYLKNNLDFALQHVYIFTSLKMLINVLFIVFLAIAVYGLPFISGFVKAFYKEIIFFSGLSVVYYFLIDFFQNFWYVFSLTVRKILAFLLGLSFSDVYVGSSDAYGPTLGVQNFLVGISKECSGIDSLLLFISLYIFLFVMNWKDLDKKRMALLFIPGLIFTFSYNILRVYLLMLVGIFISPEFAADAFHSNIGWILFLGFFIIFWHFGSKFAYKKD